MHHKNRIPRSGLWITVFSILLLLIAACGNSRNPSVKTAERAADGTMQSDGYRYSTVGTDPKLPPPEDNLIPTVNIAEAVGWKDGDQPNPAEGNTVSRFADDLKHPRWLYVLPNGDVLVAETNAPAQPKDDTGVKGWVMKQVMSEAGAAVPSADRITLLRDSDGDGDVDQRSIYLENLHSPFGMVLVGDKLYVANTDAVMVFPYREGETKNTANPTKLVDLPAGLINHHWTKNVVASPDGSKLYVAVGSNSNIAENGFDKEQGRAAIWEIDLPNGEHRIFASGLRNPVGMTWVEDTLWVAVNERDELGDNLVPDYMTSVKEDGFYGWPYSYFGQHIDQRVEQREPDRVEQAIEPDYALDAHTASLGLTFTDGQNQVSGFGKGMFVGQHGSWNRDPLIGYKVVFVPFSGTEPDGLPKEVLTGFVNEDGEANGRPVGVVVDKQGALLVADDVGNVVWRVSADRQNRTAQREK